MNDRTVRGRKLSAGAERQIRERHVRRIKQLQRRRFVFRSILVLICIAILLLVVMFLTPLFNIKNLSIEGNKRVSIETIRQQIPDVDGKNLFKISENDLKSSLAGISYIEDVQINKKYFPSELYITITEKLPVAAVEKGGDYRIIDSDGIVLEETSERPDNVPVLTFYHESFEKLLEDETAKKELKNFFDISCKINIINDMTAIELLESNEINFEYDGRLKVICGSNLDLEKKLPLFKETVNNPALGSNAHGEIDLSTTGKAVHRS